MTKQVPFIKMYSYALLSVFLWVVLLYLPCVCFFSSRGHHLRESMAIYALIGGGVLVLPFLMTWIYKLFSRLKNISPLKRDVIFMLFLSYWYLPFSLLSMYQEGMLLLLNIKLYLLGIFILPAPFLFVYLLRRAERNNISAKASAPPSFSKRPHGQRYQ